MTSIVIALLLLQNPAPTKAAPIEPKATTEADQKRLSQYPNLGGGLYNIDAVPEEGIPQPPVPPASRDSLYWQKKAIANLSKRLAEAQTLLTRADFKKLSSLFRNIEREFDLSRGKRAIPGSRAASTQDLALLISELQETSRRLKPEIVDVEITQRLAELANVAATMSQNLAASAKVRPRPQE